MQRKDLIYIIIILLIIALGVVLFLNQRSTTVLVDPNDEKMIPVEQDGGIGDGAALLDEVLDDAPIETIGTSANGHPVDVFRFGTGDTNVLLIGGIHGAYSGNTSVLAYELIDYLETNPTVVPESVRLHIIPTLNPDGLVATVDTYSNIEPAALANLSETDRVAGRFNGNDVDLNRNFGCNWEASGVWRNQTVSGGHRAFSEPEAIALRDYVARIDPAAAVVWFGAEGAVYPSACGGNPSDAAMTLATNFATAAGYEQARTFDSYDITGDVVNWLASEDVPAISVLLSDYQRTEFAKNLAGIRAMLSVYAD